MKFKFDVECTPEEARAFLGLPNIAPMQDRMMEELENKMAENIRNLSPEEMVKTWMPATIQGFSDMQKIFWSQMGVNMPSQQSDDN
tara:strand:+ start:4151 stop:4408 length:258 start_codon:yes stop_codon:yes gene_type:complete